MVRASVVWSASTPGHGGDRAVLAGTTGLTKSDAGTLILTGANSYAGGTAIRGGTLQIGAGGTDGSIGGDVETMAAWSSIDRTA
jgi:autotransporter-associated beta strand protein